MTAGCASPRCRRQTVCLGPFVAGEIPDPLVYEFLDADGNPMDLTGYTASFAYAELWGTPAAVRSAVADGSTVTYTWQASDLAVPGRYHGELWTGEADGIPAYASVQLRWNVHRPAVPRS
jgi:hypothetical protein